MVRILAVAYFVFVTIWFLLVFHMSVVFGQQNPNCTEFGFQITTTCCCTNDCCREADENEFAHVRDGLYRSNVTGQLVYRTGWSPDGRTIKCACDQIEGKWTKHPGADVRCLFMPMPNS
jgi:hypothetical protein